MKTEKIPDTRIVAYRIGGVIHCIECATTWAIDQSIKRGGYGRVSVGEHNVIEYLVAYSNGTWDRDIVPNPISKFLARALDPIYAECEATQCTQVSQ